MDGFLIPETELAEVKKEIHGLNVNTPTTLNNIPAKILVLTSDICSPVIIKIYNTSKENCDFPNALKMADITPAHKKRRLQIKKTIVLSAFFRRYQKSCRAICMIIYTCIWVNICRHTFAGFAGAIVHNTAKFICLKSGIKRWIISAMQGPY